MAERVLPTPVELSRDREEVWDTLFHVLYHNGPEALLSVAVDEIWRLEREKEAILRMWREDQGVDDD